MDSFNVHDRCIRRSAVRSRILCVLLAHGPLYASHLIDKTALDQRRLWLAMHGNGKQYRVDLGLVTCGLIEEIRVRRERRYRLTAAGRSVARALVRERRQRGWG